MYRLPSNFTFGDNTQHHPQSRSAATRELFQLMLDGEVDPPDLRFNSQAFTIGGQELCGGSYAELPEPKRYLLRCPRRQGTSGRQRLTKYDIEEIRDLAAMLPEDWNATQKAREIIRQKFAKFPIHVKTIAGVVRGDSWTTHEKG